VDSQSFRFALANTQVEVDQFKKGSRNVERTFGVLDERGRIVEYVETANSLGCHGTEITYMFNPKLKPGFYISNFVMRFGIGILAIFLGSRILLPNTDPVPVFIVIFNILNMVGGMFAVFMQKLQYNCGTELLSFFLNIESIRVNLQTRGMKMFAIFLLNVRFINIDIL
jgi:hypothetical protein